MSTEGDRKEGSGSAISRRGLSLFHVGGIDVRLDYSWFLIFGLILLSLSVGYFPQAYPDQPTAAYWVAGVAATLLFFLSILAHEMSHALAARLSGIRVPAITLFLFGGVSHMEEEARTPAAEFRVAVVGPLMSFVLAGLFWGVHRSLPDDVPVLGAAVVQYLSWVNAALGVFNLLPGFPLDGGRVLRAVAWWRTGSLRRATRVAADAGKGLAVGLMLLGGLRLFAGDLLGGLWIIFIGMFLRTMAEAGYQNLVLVQTLEDVTVADVAIRDPVCVPSHASLRSFVDEYLLAHGYRGFPVVDGGTVQGLITVGDLEGVAPEDRGSITVKERMHPLQDAMRVAPDTPLTQALKQLGEAPGDRLLVMRGDRLEGLLTRGSLSRFVEIRRVLESA